MFKNSLNYIRYKLQSNDTEYQQLIRLKEQILELTEEYIQRKADYSKKLAQVKDKFDSKVESLRDFSLKI